MTALEDARDRLPVGAEISRNLMNFLIERSGGSDQITVSAGLLSRELANSVIALEARLLTLENQLAEHRPE